MGDAERTNEELLIEYSELRQQHLAADDARAATLRNLIARRNWPLVAFACERGGDYSDESYSEAAAALARAIEKYDPSRPIKFSTFAATIMIRAVVRCRQSQAKYAARFKQAVEDFGNSAVVDHRRTERETAVVEDLRDAVATLLPVERTIIRRCYNGERLSAISKAFGRSQTWAGQIRKRAISKLREAMGVSKKDVVRLRSK